MNDLFRLIVITVTLAGLTGCPSGGNVSSPAAGTQDNPIVIPVDPGASYQSTPYSGTVGNGPLYFRLTGLIPNNQHTVVLAGMADNADLSVYTNAFVTLACSSSNAGTADDSCAADTTAQGELYIKVDGSLTSAGTIFTLNAGT